MKLSIILISYNQEKYLEKSIESILKQQFPFDAEIIVADDNSTDKSFTIIKEKLAACPWPVVYLPNNINLGISKNYQRAIQVCSGEYIAVMEGDDYWTDPRRLDKHLSFLDNHHECVMSMNRFVWYHEHPPEFIVEPWKRSEDYYYVSTQQMAEGNKLGNLSACVFRADIIKGLNSSIYDMEIADWMLGMAVSEYGLIGILSGVMSVYRIHRQGNWAGQTKKNQSTLIAKAVDKYDAFFQYKYTNNFNVLRKQHISSKQPIAARI